MIRIFGGTHNEQLALAKRLILFLQDENFRVNLETTSEPKAMEMDETDQKIFQDLKVEGLPIRIQVSE